MSGIFYSGSGSVNITGQAIGSDNDEDNEQARRIEREARRLARDAARASTEDNAGVRNTGSGSVTIKNSTIGGRFIRNARITRR